MRLGLVVSPDPIFHIAARLDQLRACQLDQTLRVVYVTSRRCAFTVPPSSTTSMSQKFEETPMPAYQDFLHSGSAHINLICNSFQILPGSQLFVGWIGV